MGSCLSKKSTNSSCAATTAVEKPPPEQTKSNAQVVVEKKKVAEEETVKKEIFVIKHRKSHEIDRKSVGEEKCEVKKGAEVSEMAKNGCSANSAMNNVGVLGLGPGSGVLAAAPVRTSSCTKEEVDAILIQCGRLSRSSSTGKAALSGSLGSGENGNSVQKGRKYSGSKRSYDFDHENGRGGEIDQGCEDNPVVDDDNGVGVLVVGERSNRHRQRQRQSRSVGSPSSKGRRRTPSRERDQAQQRSGSRERVSNGSGRRVSRSPGRRSESPITNSSGVTAAAANSSSSSSSANPNNNSSNNGGGGGGSNRPGKMVSVPATVSSMAMVDKSNNNAGGGTETISASAVKRIQVKRNVGCDAAAVVVGSRTAASPRARSPARVNARAVSSENQNTNSAQNMQQQQQPLSLSRSNSRKAEQSPYRRNPLGEIDTNVVIAVPHNTSQQAPVQKLNTDDAVSEKRVKKGIVDKNPQAINNNVAVNVVGSGSEILKSTTSHGVTRSRSSRLSRDLDINPEALSNAAPSSYTALLLEDIQNFHQKNSNTPVFTLPACVSKACSILEAVADLNSSTGSNFSAAAAFSDDKKRIPTMTTDQFSKLCNNTGSFGAQQTGKKGVEKKDPFMQSEVVVVGDDDDDLMEPSFHKYVTVRRGGTLGGEDMEEQESSGSNSFVSGQQHWTSSSSWEPNSADSTDCWTSSSRSNCREDSRSPAVVSFQRFALSEPGYYDADEARRRLSGKKRDSDLQQNGIGKGSRLGSRGGLQSSVPAAAAAAN